MFSSCRLAPSYTPRKYSVCSKLCLRVCFPFENWYFFPSQACFENLSGLFFLYRARLLPSPLPLPALAAHRRGEEAASGPPLLRSRRRRPGVTVFASLHQLRSPPGSGDHDGYGGVWPSSSRRHQRAGKLWCLPRRRPSLPASSLYTTAPRPPKWPSPPRWAPSLHT